ncbi:MAG: chemotaxis protein CheB [Pseudonocardia sp.]
MTTRNLVVIGASAGGVETLRALVAELPEDLPAAVLVVLHLRSGGTSALAHILDRSGRLPAVTASPRQDLRRGTIVVAPPDHHLLVDDGQYVLSRGPTESGHRPAVDALFRSAARAAGARVIAVVLSGVLDDGAAGAVAVARRGITPDHVLPAAALGTMLGRRAGEPVELAGTPPPSELESREANIARHGEHSVAHDLAELGELAGYACPDCDGGLLLLSGTERMRCRVGHAWTAEALLAAQADRTEKALWTAYRMLEERAELAIRLEELARGRNSDAMVRRHADEGREAREAAAVLRTLLLTEVPEHRTVTRPAPKADPVST